MKKRLQGVRTFDKCHDCEHCDGKWFTSTYDSPYGRETTGHGYDYCKLDEELEISSFGEIPKYCPLFGKPKPKPKPNRIIKWYNDKTHDEISRERNGITKIDFIQDEPNGKTFTVTIDQLEKILIKHFGDKNENKN